MQPETNIRKTGKTESFRTPTAQDNMLYIILCFSHISIGFLYFIVYTYFLFGGMNNFGQKNIVDSCLFVRGVI